MGDYCVELKINGLNNELIIIKFQNIYERKEFKDIIKEKINSIYNDERKIFGQYLGNLIDEYKNEKKQKEEKDTNIS